MLIDRTGVAEDGWTFVTDGDIPDGAVILPLERLDEAWREPALTGVHVAAAQDPLELPPLFARVSLISVEFPSFADGRGFSIGRCVRSLGFAGRLRATGPVIADQFSYLLACGFDEVAVPEALAERQPVEQWTAQLARITAGYQRGYGRSILDQRTGR